MRNALVRRILLTALLVTLVMGLTLNAIPTRSLASSHREAPLIVADP